jgi:hypothetical protein
MYFMSEMVTKVAGKVQFRANIKNQQRQGLKQAA